MAGQAALRKSEARNRQILDSAIDYAIVATELDARVTRWNEGARRILDWTEEEMLGQTAERFFTPEDVAAGQLQKEMRSALEAGRGIDERWHQRKGGERFWASGEMTALRDGAGIIVGYVKVLRDRTAERQRVQQLQLLSRASEGLLDAERPDDVLNAVLDASAELIDFDQCCSYTLTAAISSSPIVSGSAPRPRMPCSARSLTARFAASSRKPSGRSSWNASRPRRSQGTSPGALPA